MKRIFTLLILSSILFFVAKAQNVVIPDSLFKQALLQNELININADNEIQISEAEAFADVLDLKNKGIADLTGIEAFVNVSYLIVHKNELQFLDISNNLNITGLNCIGNNIETLIVGNNPNLNSILAYDNNITSIDLSQLINLETIRINRNNIAVLDLSNNINLTTIGVEECGLQNLNVRNGNNTIVNYFYAANNPDLTCVTVDDPDYSSEHWTDIDPGLEFSTDCFAYTINFTITDGINPIQNATVISKDIVEMNAVSDATGIAVFNDVRKKEYLYKVEADGYKGVVGRIMVDVPEVNVEVELISGTPEVLNIPDEAFKTYLLSNVEINTNNDSIIYRTEAEYFNGKVGVDYLGINDLSGIEAFRNITTFSCDNNSIDTLNLSNNIMLEDVSCTYCNIDSLILGDNQYLSRLLCYENNIKGLNLLGLSSLETIRCSDNQIVSLDLTQNNQLLTFGAEDNSLISVDIRNGNNTAISAFYITGNSDLNCINVDDVVFATANWTAIDEQVIFSTDCSASFDVSFSVNNGVEPVQNAHFKFDGIYYDTNENGVVLIEGVDMGNHVISIIAETFESIVDTIEISEATTIDITLQAGEPDIVYIPDYNFRTYLLSVDTINVNSDTEIQVSEATSIVGLFNVSSMNIEDITGIEAFTEITSFDCNNNKIITLDLSNNNHLNSISCRNNYTIETLVLGSQPNLVSLLCYSNQLVELDVSAYPLLEVLRCGDNAIETLDLTNNSNLTTFDCSDSNINQLDIRNGNNEAISFFYITGNQNLTCVSVDDIDFSTTNWTDIDEGLTFSLSCNGSSDASLASILIENVEIDGFEVDIFEYEIEVDAGSESLPVVVATTSDANAIVEITQVEAIPGTAIIDVVAEDGATSQYIIHISTATGIAQLNAIRVNVYPNPVSEYLTVYSTEELNKIELYSVNGKMIAELDPVLKQHNISYLESGIYYLKVISDETNACLRFVKSNN